MKQDDTENGLPAAATRTESLRLKLEEEILNGILMPGTRLDEEDIALRFRISRTPVREALKALAATGLVDLRPHQGAFVAAPSLKTVLEMVEVMSALETTCAELAARRHTKADREALVRAQKMCEDQRSLDDPAAFYEANIVLHDVIYQASRNEFLVKQTTQLRQRLEPYRRRISYHEGLINKSNHEHGEVVQAILAMDAARAGSAMRAHLASQRDDIASMF
jgi:DNA-binding GntR family transcriptional regulator